MIVGRVLAGHLSELGRELDAHGAPAGFLGGRKGRADACEGVQHRLAREGEELDELADHGFGELRGVTHGVAGARRGVAYKPALGEAHPLSCGKGVEPAVLTHCGASG